MHSCLTSQKEHIRIYMLITRIINSFVRLGGENLVRSCRPTERHAADGQPFSSPSDARMGLGLSGARLSARAAGDILPESGSYRSLAAFSYRHGRTQQRRPRHPAFQLHPQTRDQRWRSYPAATLERFGQWQRMRGAARHGTAGERSEELQSLMRRSYAVFFLDKKQIDSSNSVS